VTGEVRGKHLEPITVDALLQVAVTDQTGARTGLDRADEDSTRVLGAGVDGESRRGAACDFLKNPLPYAGAWERHDPSNPSYRNATLDEKILSIDLRAWEELTWASGNVPRVDAGFSRGRRAENQNVLTKTSVVSFADLPADPAIELYHLEVNSLGVAAPNGREPGVVAFPFECPVEVDDLFVSTEGTMGRGQIAVSLIPIVNTPLIADQAWVPDY
jgi:hypothetical protein